jgi:hypothetical protein
MRAIGPLAAVHVANSLAQEFHPNPAPEHIPTTEMDQQYLDSIGASASLPIWREIGQVELGEK